MMHIVFATAVQPILNKSGLNLLHVMRDYSKAGFQNSFSVEIVCREASVFINHVASRIAALWYRRGAGINVRIVVTELFRRQYVRMPVKQDVTRRKRGWGLCIETVAVGRKYLQSVSRNVSVVYENWEG